MQTLSLNHSTARISTQSLDCLEASNNPPKVGNMIGVQQHESREKERGREAEQEHMTASHWLFPMAFLKGFFLARFPIRKPYNRTNEKESYNSPFVCTCVAAGISISVLSSWLLTFPLQVLSRTLHHHLLNFIPSYFEYASHFWIRPLFISPENPILPSIKSGALLHILNMPVIFE